MGKWVEGGYMGGCVDGWVIFYWLLKFEIYMGHLHICQYKFKRRVVYFYKKPSLTTSSIFITICRLNSLLIPMVSRFMQMIYEF